MSCIFTYVQNLLNTRLTINSDKRRVSLDALAVFSALTLFKMNSFQLLVFFNGLASFFSALAYI